MLANITKSRRGLVLLSLWRSWHLRNDVVHAKGDCRIKDSVNFLNRYIKEFDPNWDTQDTGKGKEKTFAMIIL
jgi:hypothetical protein